MTPSDGWRERVENLLQAVKDVAPPGHPSPQALKSSGPLQVLFTQYVRELRQAKTRVEEWWKDLIKAEETRTEDRAEALLNVEERHSEGLAAQGFVQGVLRKFWLTCAERNRKAPAPERLSPEDLVLRWLLLSGNNELAQFLSTIAYWPIGLDKEGNWD
jgi:hypothetical protein